MSVPVPMASPISPPTTSVLIRTVSIPSVSSAPALISLNAPVVLKTMVMKCCLIITALLLMKLVHQAKCITLN